jgi:hypothetical protein
VPPTNLVDRVFVSHEHSLQPIAEQALGQGRFARPDGKKVAERA